MENKIDKKNMTIIRNSDELLDYVIGKIQDNCTYNKKIPNELGNISIESIKDYLNTVRNTLDKNIESFLRKQRISMKNIIFKWFKFDSILNNFKLVLFEDCIFEQPCNFMFYPNLFRKYFNVRFWNCKFYGDLDIESYDKECYEFNNILFWGCHFNKSLVLTNLKIKGLLFSYRGDYYIEKLKITNCEFEDRFILNQFKSKEVYFEKTVFHKKVELKNGNIADLKLIDTNFEKIFDSFGTKYGTFHCKKCIFNGFTAFEECTFSNNPENKPTEFNRSTFLDFVTFRGSKFVSGLNIDLINLRGESNFLNVNINEDKTTRQTYRIIKNSFDQAGDHIEANKYFAAEMRRYECDLSRKKKITQEKIIFKFNKWMSNFGQSYLRPLGWIIVIGLLSMCLSSYPILPCLKGLISGLNNFVKQIIPLNNILIKNKEFFTLVSYIILGPLIWQLIVAVKRHTKR